MSGYIMEFSNALDYTKKINQFLKSDLETDAKLEYIELMIEKRQVSFDRIKQMEVEQTDDIKKIVKRLFALDSDNQALIKKMLGEQRQLLDDVHDKKVNSTKVNKAQKKYLAPQEQLGYFINQRK